MVDRAPLSAEPNGSTAWWTPSNLWHRTPNVAHLAPETPFFPEEIRQRLYGRGRGVQRILFTIKDDSVVVLHVRHGARKHLSE